MRRRDGARGDFLMDVVGDIGGGAAGAEVGIVAEDHPRALARHRVGIEVLMGKRGEGDFIQVNFG